MKLILTQEVTGLGGPGDIVDVKDGYGRNYLIPQRFAIRWTKGGQKQVDMIRRGREVREIRDHDQAEHVARELADLSVTLTTRAGEGGRLFGSVTAGDIAEAVTAAGGPRLDKRRIHVGSPIKTIGEHRVSVRLHPEVTGSLTVTVVPG